MAEVKASEAAVNARRKREGLIKHPTHAIIWGCRCCYGYFIVTNRLIADTTVQEEERKRKEELKAEQERLNKLKEKHYNRVYY